MLFVYLAEMDDIHKVEALRFFVITLTPCASMIWRIATVNTVPPIGVVFIINFKQF